MTADSTFYVHLRRDLEGIEERIQRRRLLLRSLILLSSAELFSSRARSQSDVASHSGLVPIHPVRADENPVCPAAPRESSGPFPADGTNRNYGEVPNVLTSSGIIRSDIRASFGGSTTLAEGVPLQLTIKLVNTSANCEAMAHHFVYVWHCNRDGEYSLYSRNIRHENYLRGVQVTDGTGRVTFQTIFPACYTGRYPHIHFEIYRSFDRLSGNLVPVLTSQLALPRQVCEAVYTGAVGYTASIGNLSVSTMQADNVFDLSTATQLASQTLSLSGSVPEGYRGAVTVGVAS
jgi:protocatechuate 3,4-dioxygenase beta subunit